MHFHAAYYFLFLDHDCGCNVHLVESFYEMGYPLVMTNSLLLKMAIEIVSFPIKMVDLSIVMLVYQRVVHVPVIPCNSHPPWLLGFNLRVHSYNIYIYIYINMYIYIYHNPSMISRHIFRSNWSNPIISPVGFPFRQVAASGESAKPGWPGFMWWYNMIYPLVMTNSLLLKMAIYSGFSMIFPWKMVIFHSYVSLPEGITSKPKISQEWQNVKNINLNTLGIFGPYL